MMPRDDELQDAFDRPPRDRPHADPGDADHAAYAVVYAALADDAGFALPADFAEAMTVRVVPEPVRPSVYERWILPVLMLTSAAIALPAVVPQLARALRVVLGGPATGVPAAAVAALALLLVAAADRLARRRGGGPGV